MFIFFTVPRNFFNGEKNTSGVVLKLHSIWKYSQLLLTLQWIISKEKENLKESPINIQTSFSI